MSTKRQTSRPKGRVMWCDDDPEYPRDARFQVHYSLADAKGSNGNPDLKSYPCAVIPCATVKQARAIVRLHRMTPAQMVETTAKAMHARWTPDSNGKHYCGRNIEDAVACLKALNLPTP